MRALQHGAIGRDPGVQQAGGAECGFQAGAFCSGQAGCEVHQLPQRRTGHAEARVRAAPCGGWRAVVDARAQGPGFIGQHGAFGFQIAALPRVRGARFGQA